MDFLINVTSGTREVFLNPGLPIITESCPYTLVNNFTNTNDASADYPLGTTTLIWTATDENGNSTSCSMNVTVDNMSGTKGLNKTSPLIVYPNPSSGLFTLEETQNNINDLQLVVFDPLGRKVYEQTTVLNGKKSIDLSDIAEGIYFLHWSANNRSGVFKLVNTE